MAYAPLQASSRHNDCIDMSGLDVIIQDVSNIAAYAQTAAYVSCLGVVDSGTELGFGK